MRKVGGVLLAVAMVLPLTMMATPAGAAGGTVCTTSAGTAKFTPPLPILTSKVLVNGKSDGDRHGRQVRWWRRYERPHDVHADRQEQDGLELHHAHQAGPEVEGHDRHAGDHVEHR